jgi:hypothetical protein
MMLWTVLSLSYIILSETFSPVHLTTNLGRKKVLVSRKSTNDDDLSYLLTARLPTSVEDQVRQASESLKRATADGIHRHSVRLLLPVIGATELDDWPGGARQMMEAANPLMGNILKGMDKRVSLSTVVIDAADGVGAIMAQANEPKDDSCTVLLPSADNIDTLQDLEKQVGPKRNLIVVNAQWRRRSDFGGNFFGDSGTYTYAESFIPTFSLTNMICEGENIRILRTYPGPWRVFVRKEILETGEVDWLELGSKEFVESKPDNWESQPQNQRDGGLLFNFGQPSYQEITDMLNNSANWTPKNPAERAQAAFNFIKDSL